jgi:DNA-binding Lrp family transcriptional regulator
MLTEREKEVLSEVQGDLAVEARPYATIARRLGISEEEVLETLRGLSDRGIIRRFGVTIRHQISGFEANAMAAFLVEEERADDVAEVIVTYPQVTHCYRRIPMGGWKYNLFAMIHGSSEDECREIAAEIAEKCGISDYQLLFSHTEHKKTSMRYF